MLPCLSKYSRRLYAYESQRGNVRGSFTEASGGYKSSPDRFRHARVSLRVGMYSVWSAAVVRDTGVSGVAEYLCVVRAYGNNDRFAASKRDLDRHAFAYIE